MLVFFSKAPCPLSHAGFYCLGETNLMTFQQYSNYSPGGVCRGRRSLTPEQIWFQTAYLHSPETDENCSCLRVFILHCLAWVEAYVSLPHQCLFVRNFSFLNPLVYSTNGTAAVVPSSSPLSWERRNRRSSDNKAKGCGKTEGLQRENHPPPKATEMLQSHIRKQ